MDMKLTWGGGVEKEKERRRTIEREKIERHRERVREGEWRRDGGKICNISFEIYFECRELAN